MCFLFNVVVVVLVKVFIFWIGSIVYFQEYDISFITFPAYYRVCAAFYFALYLF